MKKRFFTTAAVTLLISACSGSGSDSEQGSDSSKLQLTGSFFESSTAPIEQKINLDHCTNLNSPPMTIHSHGDSTRIPAGSHLVISSSGGTFTSIGETDNLVGSYSEVLDFPSQLNDFEADILGDVFPAIQNIQIPSVEPLIVLSSTPPSPLTETTSFQWTPATNSDSTIYVTFGNLDNEYITCHVKDDGEFSFEQNLSDTDFTELDWTYGSISRLERNLMVTSNAAIDTQTFRMVSYSNP